MCTFFFEVAVTAERFKRDVPCRGPGDNRLASHPPIGHFKGSPCQFVHAAASAAEDVAFPDGDECFIRVSESCCLPSDDGATWVTGLFSRCVM